MNSLILGRQWLNERFRKFYFYFIYSQNSKQINKLNSFSRHTVKHTNAACFIMGYETFRYLVFYGGEKKKKPLNTNEKRIREIVKRELLDATDLIVCDEGHMIKSLKSQTNRAVSQIRTKRRIVLTGTPMQNNLMECKGDECEKSQSIIIIFLYSDYAMVDFVKPLLLGTPDQFRYMYANPISKGQHKDSSRQEIKSMRLQSYNLNRELESIVHVSYNDLSILQQNNKKLFFSDVKSHSYLQIYRRSTNMLYTFQCLKSK